MEEVESELSDWEDEDEVEFMEIEIEEAPIKFKSDVWKHFGFPKTVNKNGEKIVDKTNTICKHCKNLVPYKQNTSNMSQQ